MGCVSARDYITGGFRGGYWGNQFRSPATSKIHMDNTWVPVIPPKCGAGLPHHPPLNGQGNPSDQEIKCVSKGRSPLGLGLDDNVCHIFKHLDDNI